MRLKTYVIDQLIFLIIGVCLIFFIPYMCYHVLVLTIIGELIAILSFGYLCRRLIVLPLDMILHKCSQEVYFSKVSSIDKYEFYRNKFYCEWKFYSLQGTLELLVPVALKEEEIHNMNKPILDQKVRVYYYKFSKIISHWEVI